MQVQCAAQPRASDRRVACCMQSNESAPAELAASLRHACTPCPVQTIGDCYMAVTGLLVETPAHAEQLCEFGKSMLAAAAGVRNPLGGTVRIRVGIHSGPVMSGIVGSIRARYGLFGGAWAAAPVVAACIIIAARVPHQGPPQGFQRVSVLLAALLRSCDPSWAGLGWAGLGWAGLA